MLRVYTRGYNMPSHWDYCRLKAVLQTHHVKNVTLGAKGDYPPATTATSNHFREKSNSTQKR